MWYLFLPFFCMCVRKRKSWSTQEVNTFQTKFQKVFEGMFIQWKIVTFGGTEPKYANYVPLMMDFCAVTALLQYP